MNSEKECFDFIEKQISNPEKDLILSILKNIEEKSNGKYWEAPALGKFPEDGNDWSMWWKSKKDYVSIDFYPDDKEKDIFWYTRKPATNNSSADECLAKDLPESLIEQILKIKYIEEND